MREPRFPPAYFSESHGSLQAVGMNETVCKSSGFGLEFSHEMKANKIIIDKKVFISCVIIFFEDSEKPKIV